MTDRTRLALVTAAAAVLALGTTACNSDDGSGVRVVDGGEGSVSGSVSGTQGSGSVSGTHGSDG